MLYIRFALVLAPITLVGCASTILSDDKIKSETAGVLGASPDQVVISNRTYDGMTNTFYTASSGGRTYACTINGGTVMSFGQTNPPTCNPK